MNPRARITFLIIILILAIGAFASTKNVRSPSLTSTDILNDDRTLIGSVSYVCNAGKTIAALYYESKEAPVQTVNEMPVPTGSVALSLSDGRAFTLSQSISADGARYTNPDESFIFWSKGNSALVLENDEEKSYIGCVSAE